MQLNRRDFVRLGLAAGYALGHGPAARGDAAPATRTGGGVPIDRAAMVRRHNPLVTRIDPFAALTVGNGEFAFTADVTGLQTFLDPYHAQFPLCTTAHW